MNKAKLFILAFLFVGAQACAGVPRASGQNPTWADLFSLSCLSKAEITFGDDVFRRPRGVWVDLDSDGQPELVVAGIRKREVKASREQEEEGFIAVFRSTASRCDRIWDMTFVAMIIGDETRGKLTVHQVNGRGVVLVGFPDAGSTYAFENNVLVFWDSGTVKVISIGSDFGPAHFQDLDDDGSEEFIVQTDVAEYPTPRSVLRRRIYTIEDTDLRELSGKRFRRFYNEQIKYLEDSLAEVEREYGPDKDPAFYRYAKILDREAALIRRQMEQ